MTNNTSGGGHPAIALAFRSSLQSGQPRILEVRSGLNVTDQGERLPSSDLGKLLFFGTARQLSATLGGIHPHLPKGTIHESTSYGLQSLISRLDLGKLRDTTQLASEMIEGSAAILGGPVANLHARLVMGCGGVSPLFGVPLPVGFDCSSIATSTSDNYEPWRVAVDGRTSQNECLVITCVPMDRSSDRLTIFSGLHGAGTRAIDLVLTDAPLMEQLYRDTRHLLAWQAIIEVRARDIEFPESLGLYRVFEITNINFDDPNNLVRANLLLTESRIMELVRLLPPRHEIDFTDAAATGIVNLQSYKLAKVLGRGIVAQGKFPKSHASKTDPGRPKRRAGDRSALGPLHNREANMNLASEKSEGQETKQTRRRWGRPPKPKSDASLSHRLQIMVSSRDIEMIETIIELSGVASMGQVVRDAIHREHERVKTTKGPNVKTG